MRKILFLIGALLSTTQLSAQTTDSCLSSPEKLKKIQAIIISQKLKLAYEKTAANLSLTFYQSKSSDPAYVLGVDYSTKEIFGVEMIDRTLSLDSLGNPQCVYEFHQVYYLNTQGQLTKVLIKLYYEGGGNSYVTEKIIYDGKTWSGQTKLTEKICLAKMQKIIRTFCELYL
jgi:hypothetical protein